MGQRRRFAREFKLEAVKLVRERGVSVAQVARDLDVHENMLRKWVKEFAADPQHAFPGEGQMKREQLEINIECFYNPRRRHSTLGYLSPIDFEKQAALA